MTRSMTMTGFTAAEMDELKRRQARLLRGDMDIRPAPRSRRARNSQEMATAQAEQLIRALKAGFPW